jgi:hypothetical protein
VAKGAEKRPEPRHFTVLRQRPDYLRAIGTLSVEVVNMEVFLAHLLSAITKLHVDVSDAIYFAPQAFSPRLQILLGAAKHALKERPEYLSRAVDYAAKAREYGNRRNDIVHNVWGITDSTGEITRKPLPLSDAGRPVPITEINQTIYNVRILMNSVIELAEQIDNDRTYWPSQKTLPAQAQAAATELHSLLVVDPPAHEHPP